MEELDLVRSWGISCANITNIIRIDDKQTTECVDIYSIVMHLVKEVDTMRKKIALLEKG